ncbi:MAG: penicillin-binding protein [Mangrovibacterium sp.]
MISKRSISARFFLFYVLFVVMAFLIIYKIVYIQQIDTADVAKLKKKLNNETRVLEANRGNLCADDGSLLATSIPYFSLRFDLKAEGVLKHYHEYADAFSLEVAKYFGISKSAFKRRLDEGFRKGNRWFLIYPKRVDYNTLQGFKELSTMAFGKMGSGFTPQQENKRFMPHGDMASRTIGTLNKGAYGGVHGNIGYSGIEGMMQTYLAGSDGLAYMRNYSGRWLPRVVKKPQDGKDVITTINVSLQDFTENALTAQLEKSRAEWGAAVVMEVATGDVKAIANVGRKKDGTYGEVYNYAIGHQGCAEPGSTFKLMSLMAALDDGKIDTTDVFDTGIGRWSYKGQTIYDSDYGHGGHGKINVKQILEYSSNIGTAKAITQSYEGNEEAFIDRLYSFGLNRKLDLGFAGEGKPYIKYPTDSNWWGPSLAWISYGYEIELTPMQTLTFYNGVANNGRMMKPRFVKEIRTNGTSTRRFEPEVLNPALCSESTLRKVRAMLRGVCVEGTGKALQRSLPIPIAGKTGTAQVAYGDAGYGHKTGHKRYQASFAGYFPADNPKYSMIVVVLDPKGSFYGGSVAGPVFREIALKVYSMMMTPIEDDEQAKTNDVQLAENGFASDVKEVANGLKLAEIEQKSMQSGQVSLGMAGGKTTVSNIAEGKMEVPDVVGMTAGDALYLLESKGLRVHFSGFGKVQTQSLEAGTAYKEGQIINLKLG